MTHQFDMRSLLLLVINRCLRIRSFRSDAGQALTAKAQGAAASGNG